MHSLDRIGAQALQNVTLRLQKGGVPARRSDVIGMVVAHAPDNVNWLQRVAQAETWHGGSSRLLARVPSPVSQRLNVLLDAVQEHVQPCTRGRLLAALVRVEAGRSDNALVARHRRYCGMNAGELAVSWDGSDGVLSLNRPKPGPRPQPREIERVGEEGRVG